MTVPCSSCAGCERELSAVRLELQAVVRERDQYRDALEALKDVECAFNPNNERTNDAS